MMNTGGFPSSSFLSEEACFSVEKPIGAKMMDHMNCYSGLNSDGMLKTEGVTSLSLEKRVTLGSQMANGFVLRSNDMNHGQNANVLLGRHIVGAERAVSVSLPNATDHYIGTKGNLNKDSKSHLLDGDKVTFMGAQHENGLFSSSLSDLFNQNSTVAVGSHQEEDEAFESLAELEAKTIGNLLPDDDDLLAGVTENVVRTNNREEVEGLDLFSSSGGLELGEDACLQRNFEFSQVNSNNRMPMSMGMDGGEHSSEEHPSRTLFIRNISSSIEDSELLMLFEQCGDICKLHTACKHQGFVMISYYDIRAACNAMKILRNKSIYGRLDIHFSKEKLSDKDINQGTLVVLNLDSAVSNDALHEIFSTYGEIMEIREAPHISSRHKCIEFYDTRAAEAAFCALNRSDINGQQIKLELGQPCGSNRLFQPFLTKLEQDRTSHNLGTSFSGSRSYGDTIFRANNDMAMMALSPLSTNGGPLSPIMDNAVSSSVTNSIQSLVRVEPRRQSGIAESGHLWNRLKYEFHGSPNFHPHSLPEYHDGLASGHPFGSPNNITANFSPQLPKVVDGQQFHRVNSNGQSIEMTEVFGSPANGSCLSPGHHYMRNNSHQPRPQAVMWPNSPSFVNGIGAAHPQQLLAVPQAPSHVLNAMPLNNHPVRSAPSINPPLWERRHRYVRESPDAAGFHLGSLGNLGISGNSPHPMEFVPHNVYPSAAGTGMDFPIPSKNIGMHPHHQRCAVFPTRGQMHPMMSSLESPNERTRNRRNGGSNQSDNKKHFELDLDRIMRGEDKRTTLMIKNIPNKYTSKMLLAAIDERHKGTYDFLYLPIDFKNKCNVGYAFINMTDPSFIVPFYHTFNGKKWEKFNSEKVASLAYARIQGKAALVAHFQNSSLMNEDKRCRPILFHTDGPNAGDQVPFPMGSNIRTRLGKTQANTSEENIQSTPPQASLSWDDHCNNEDSSAGSGKDSD